MVGCQSDTVPLYDGRGRIARSRGGDDKIAAAGNGRIRCECRQGYGGRRWRRGRGAAVATATTDDNQSEQAASRPSAELAGNLHHP